MSRDIDIIDNHIFRPAIELDIMGSNTSKPEHSGYQWKASGPPGASLPVLDSLQTSPETDASREKLVEKQIQARVAEELKKLQKREAETLAQAHEKLAASTEDKNAEDGLSTHTVSKEVEELRRRLEERKQVRELPEGVEKSRSEVIRCLRENDRRPLDCWQEVESFKAEVKKLEKTWVDRVVS